MPDIGELDVKSNLVPRAPSQEKALETRLREEASVSKDAMNSSLSLSFLFRPPNKNKICKNMSTAK